MINSIQDASWILNEVDAVMAKISVEWDSSECDVMGGEVSEANLIETGIILVICSLLTLF